MFHRPLPIRTRLARDRRAIFIEYIKLEDIPCTAAGDDNWSKASGTYNLQVPVTPALVIYPTNSQHIITTLLFARIWQIKVQARCGGHSYASHSNGGEDGAAVIDLEHFNQVASSPTAVQVSGGVRLGNMARSIYQNHRLALPHGTCAAVGVGGHLTHGGFGCFSRAWGLAGDRIVGMDVITADGEQRFINEDNLPDLYFAMRGAAESFGIVRRFHLSPVQAPKIVTHWTIKLPIVYGNVRLSVLAFQEIQRFVHNPDIFDRRVGLNVSVSANYFAIDGTFLGSIQELWNILDVLVAYFESSILKDTPRRPGDKNPPIEYEFKQLSWPESLKRLNQGEISTDTSEDPKHSTFFAKSVVVPEPGLNRAALTSFFKRLITTGKDAPIDYFILIDLWGGVDSQINTQNHHFSAFTHRDACWVAQIYGSARQGVIEVPTEGIDFINGLAHSMTKYLRRFGAYANYADPSLARDQAHELYYGARLTAMLGILKQRWDPYNVFSHPQSILPHDSNDFGGIN